MGSRIWRQILTLVIWDMLLYYNVFERTFHEDLKTEKNFEICLSSQKI